MFSLQPFYEEVIVDICDFSCNTQVAFLDKVLSVAVMTKLWRSYPHIYIHILAAVLDSTDDARRQREGDDTPQEVVAYEHSDHQIKVLKLLAEVPDTYGEYEDFFLNLCQQVLRALKNVKSNVDAALVALCVKGVASGVSSALGEVLELAETLVQTAWAKNCLNGVHLLFALSKNANLDISARAHKTSFRDDVIDSDEICWKENLSYPRICTIALFARHLFVSAVRDHSTTDKHHALNLLSSPSYGVPLNPICVTCIGALLCSKYLKQERELAENAATEVCNVCTLIESFFTTQASPLMVTSSAEDDKGVLGICSLSLLPVLRHIYTNSKSSLCTRTRVYTLLSKINQYPPLNQVLYGILRTGDDQSVAMCRSYLQDCLPWAQLCKVLDSEKDIGRKLRLLSELSQSQARTLFSQQILPHLRALESINTLDLHACMIPARNVRTCTQLHSVTASISWTCRCFR